MCTFCTGSLALWDLMHVVLLTAKLYLGGERKLLRSSWYSMQADASMHVSDMHDVAFTSGILCQN